MSHSTSNLPESRELTPAERRLIRWMLEHGGPGASAFVEQLERARVHSRCACGCASIYLAIDDARPNDLSMNILGDFQWRTESGAAFGAFVYEQDGLLAGLDLWSMDGQVTPNFLPLPEELRPM